MYYTALFCIILHYTALHCSTLYYTILYYTIPHYTVVLYCFICIILHYTEKWVLQGTDSTPKPFLDIWGDDGDEGKGGEMRGEPQGGGGCEDW